ncbi:MAG: signal peptidase II [Deltaproteobacteria bacterium]|nr:signal peptidase II [Deltaproteobacteria bacterium]
MSSKYKILFIILLLGVFADQLSKHYVVQHLALSDSFSIIPGYFDIVHYRNTGAAFGMFAQWASPLREVFFYGVFSVAFIFLGYSFYSTPLSDRFSLVSLSLIFSGALGNIVDRLFRGSVVDFLLFHWQDKIIRVAGHTVDLVWPAFNVADSCITVGVILLLLSNLRRTSPKETDN